MSYDHDESEAGPSSSALLGTLIIAVLCLSVLVIPLLMGKTNLKEDEKQFVQQQMHQIVDQHLATEVPITLKNNVMKNGGYTPPAITGTAAVVADEITEADYKGAKELNHARELRFHGKTDEAIQLMESYVRQHPNNVVARVELANCYLKSKQPRKARLACIAGLKAHPSEQQKKTLWQIIERCPKGT